MERRVVAPRDGWQETVAAEGLIFWETELPDGTSMPYWTDGAYYAFTPAEIVRIEAAANELMEMCVVAGDHMIEQDWFARMGIPELAVEAVRETWESEPPMVYGRFDLAYDGRDLKLLEFNADTPTSLLESAVCQWNWIRDQFPELDQFNLLHEALVARWRELAPRLPGRHVHFVWTGEEASGEDAMTVAYMAETAKAAGLETTLMSIEELGWNDVPGFLDPSGLQVKSIFKLYPWEWMVHERYAGRAMFRLGTAPGQTQWIEPVWKMLWSNKALLVALWECFPGHELLLPASFEPLAGAHVRKPLLAREGANTTIVDASGAVLDSGPDQDYGAEGFVFQEYFELPQFPYDGPGMGDRARPVLGAWVVDMVANGLGIREADGLITNNLSRFVPHVIE